MYSLIAGLPPPILPRKRGGEYVPCGSFVERVVATGRAMLRKQFLYRTASGCRSGAAAWNSGSAMQARSIATIVGYGARSTPKRRAL